MSGGILGGLLNSMDSGLLGSGAQMGNGILGNMSAGGSSPQYSTGIDFLDKFGEAINNNTGLLLGYASNGYEGALQGMRQDEFTRRFKQAQNEKEQKKVKAQELVTKYGLPAGMEADPDQVFSLIGQIEARNRTREPSEWEKLTQGLSPDEVQRARRYRLGLETKPATTDDMVEYEYAKKDPAFAQYQRSKKGATNAPSGYAYGPDGKLAPIPGGPQDPERDINEPLPAELAARFGLANQYFKRFDGIEADLRSKDPKSVGAWDRFGFGESGAIQRDMKLGSEAMSRMLTGAGMTKEEADNEVKQYLPGPYDSPATVLDKQKRLRASLRDMQREALRGRRSNRQIEGDYPAFAVEPYSSDVRGSSSGAQGAVKGQTRSGVTWSAK